MRSTSGCRSWAGSLDEGGEGLVELALCFGGDGIEHQRQLARTGHAREHRDLLLRDVQRDVLEVILSCAANLDVLAVHHS
jgi:hypothetical protein